MRQIGITLVLLLILASAPAFSQSFDDLSIRPGVGIGPVRVGMTLDQVTALLGRRYDAEGTEGDLKVYRWNLQGSQHTGVTAVPVLTVGVGASNTVETVGTTSTAFTMARGAGLGFSISTFKEDLQAPSRGFKDTAGVRHLYFDTAGIAVTYDIRAAGLTTTKSLMVFKAASAMPGPPPAILPGEGIGPVRLGMSTDDVIRSMGRAPSERQRLSNGDDFLLWVTSDKDPFGHEAWLVVYVDPREGVDFISTDSVTHRTSQGNTPGTSILELQAEFGARFLTQTLAISGTAFLGIWYDQHGITGLYLPIDSEKRIIRIAVFKKG